jgi:prepilin-type N-terminal cleavage/methylation domain-containing protein/prepilin-type processing-associated H-X9-DG protein
VSLSNPLGSRAGFTLVELMVVITIVAILASLLLPALVRSKSHARSILCMRNGKQLTVAWTMYSGDNNDCLVYNLGGDTNRTSFAPDNQPNWVNNIMDWELSVDDTNTSFLDSSLLGQQYFGHSPSIFKCPEDTALSPIQQQAGWTARVRSVSMNAMVGNPGSLLQGSSNTNNPTYRQFLKDSDIPTPSSIFVFLDEHANSINDGYFLNTPGDPEGGTNNVLEWIDLPAAYHNGGGSFSFADGHTEIHQWANDSTKQPNQAYAFTLPMPIRSGDTADFNWVLQKTSVPANLPHVW